MLAIKQQSVAELIDKELLAGRGIEAIMGRFQNSVIVHALHVKEGNVSRAAVLLKTHRNNVIRWMKEAGIHRSQDDPTAENS